MNKDNCVGFIVSYCTYHHHSVSLVKVSTLKILQLGSDGVCSQNIRRDATKCGMILESVSCQVES